MPNQKPKCVIILSSKSSGSSALQKLLVKGNRGKYIINSRHKENETLFWVKAASILGLPQVNMLDSEVPIPRPKARAELIKLLTENLDSSYIPPVNDHELIFDGWRLLCQQNMPIFIEKSPHHLHQWSALELILECIDKLPCIDFLLIGLVRNPMDTLYSMWTRWKGIPEINQYEWHNGYNNLLKLKKLINEKLVIIRYEDMVLNTGCLQKIYQFIDITDISNNKHFHNDSLHKWKQDLFYGFKLSDKVMALAEEYGYRYEDMLNESYPLWPIYRQTSRFFLYNFKRPIQSRAKGIKKIIRIN